MKYYKHALIPGVFYRQDGESWWLYNKAWKKKEWSPLAKGHKTIDRRTYFKPSPVSDIVIPITEQEIFIEMI